MTELPHNNANISSPHAEFGAVTYDDLLQRTDIHPDLRPYIERLAEARSSEERSMAISPEHHQEHIELARPAVPDIDVMSTDRQDFIGEVMELGDEALKMTQETLAQDGKAIVVGLLNDETRLQFIQRQIHVPDGTVTKSFQVIEAVDTSQLAAVRERIRGHNGLEGSAEAWQERVFGEANIEALKKNLKDCFEVPTQQRQGEPVIVNGIERRPIMNISLDTTTTLQVAAGIAKREAGLATIIERLKIMQENGEKLEGGLDTMLIEAQVFGRPHGYLLGHENNNSGGTIADLYVDDHDLRQFATIDALAAELTPRIYSKPYACVDAMAQEVLVLASNSFPSGVELMHGINYKTISEVVELDAIAPRSQRKHGAGDGTKNSVNGAFVHMTGPASFASEYGTTLVGIPIDTIVKHSPYLHLEDDYTDNEFVGRNNDGSTFFGSTQYQMGAVELNDLTGAPLVFQAAFQTMHQNIQNGLLHSGIGQGRYNNFSFAAGDTPESAAAYSYPLQEVSVYIGDPDQAASLFDAAGRNGQTAELAARTNIAISSEGTLSKRFGESLNCITLPNFSMPATQSMKFFAPVESRIVRFTESMAGNSRGMRAISHTLESVKADKVANYLDGLVENGMTVREAFSVAVDSVNNQGGRAWDLITAYIGGNEDFDAAGITAEAVFNGLSDEAFCSDNILGYIANLSENAPPDASGMTKTAAREMNRWAYRGRFASLQMKRTLKHAYAVRALHLFDTRPEEFLERADSILEAGLELTDKQSEAIAIYQEAQQRLSARTAQDEAVLKGPSF